MTEIARALSVQPPTVTKIVGRLVANGFVARHEVRGDMRKSAIDLTEVGREKVTQVKTIWAELEAMALAAVSAGRDVAGVLERIETNLTRCASRSGEIL